MLLQTRFNWSVKTLMGLLTLLGISGGGASAFAHDTWLETNTAIVRAGDAVYLDVKLGNHGNNHRDFKLAGKTKLEGSTVQVLLPNSQKMNMLSRLVDLGMASNEGYWSGKFVTGSAGTHVVAFQSDKIVNHGKPVRSIRSAKTFFLVTPLLDKLNDDTTLWKQPLGHALEIVPVSHPVLFTGPSLPIEVKVLQNGLPKVDARVSFIPQGVTLAEGFDPKYERQTNSDGIASFAPTTGSRILIVTHNRAEDRKGDGYESTSYSATLQLRIPDISPCCQ